MPGLLVEDRVGVLDGLPRAGTDRRDGGPDLRVQADGDRNLGFGADRGEHRAT